MRKALLRETNYRCGYCMRNITPRVYYLDNNPNPVHDYEIYNYNKRKFYNISERCHITPRAEEDDDFKDFYNLIALCKICHHEVDKSGILGKDDERKTELAKLKLHWMIASGRFTRLEIDVLMELYKVHVNALDIMKNFTTVGAPDTYIRYRELRKQEMWIHLVLTPINNQTETYIDPNFNCNEERSLKPSIYVITYMYFLFFKVIDKKFLHDDGNKLQVNGAIPFTYLSLTELGIDFCKKFYEAYQELNKIEI